jgi:hypothetical protein
VTVPTLVSTNVNEKSVLVTIHNGAGGEGDDGVNYYCGGQQR